MNPATQPVMLSEALQRNAKHEARAFKHLRAVHSVCHAKIRDSSRRSE
jgi:hypothetical protein